MKIPKPFETALNEAKGVIHHREQLVALMEATQKRVQDLEVQIREGFRSLEASEAQNALSGVSGASAAALKRQRQLQDEQQLVSSRLSGLQAKLEATDVALVQASDRLNAERSEFAMDSLEAYRLEYEKAAQAFIQTARKGASFGQLMGVELAGLLRLQIPELLRPTDLVSIAEAKLVNGSWERSIPTTPEIEALAPIARECTVIGHQAEAIRKRRVELERIRREQEREGEREKTPAYAASTLPVSSHSEREMAAKERQDQLLRDRARASQAQTSTAVMFPNNPQKHDQAQVIHARMYPDGQR